MLEATIESGMAKVPAGKWLMSRLQPVASFGTSVVRSQRGLFVPDRAFALSVETSGAAWCSDSKRPFLTRLAALPDTSLCVVSAKILVAPAGSRVKARNIKLIPLSFRRSTAVTEFRFGWTVVATASRTAHVAVGEGETLTVRPEALVAWIGRDPTGFCPKLSALDMILPRQPRNLAFSFHGPCDVWFEGSQEKRRLAACRKGGLVF